jgi:hypothetical protein
MTTEQKLDQILKNQESAKQSRAAIGRFIYLLAMVVGATYWAGGIGGCAAVIYVIYKFNKKEQK